VRVLNIGQPPLLIPFRCCVQIMQGAVAVLAHTFRVLNQWTLGLQIACNGLIFSSGHIWFCQVGGVEDCFICPIQSQSLHASIPNVRSGLNFLFVELNVACISHPKLQYSHKQPHL